MKKGYTHIEIIIDESGSMASIKKDMEGGYNTFIEDQKKLGGECTVSQTVFSNNYKRQFSMLPLKDVPPYQLRPSGSTALLYTMVEVIDELGRQLASLPEDQRPERILVVTITDGEENCSYIHEPAPEVKTIANPLVGVINGQAVYGTHQLTFPVHEAKYSKDKLSERIKEQTDKYNWTFAYLGANQDAIKVGAGMGVGTSNSQTYTADSKGVETAFSSLSSNLRSLRSVSSDTYKLKSCNFFDDSVGKVD